MPTPVKAAFRPNVALLNIARLTPLKEISPAMRNEKKYKQIAASLKHVGLIEPIVVFPAGHGKYLVLDGHKRLDILKERGVADVRCLLATDDESYTYNKRVNYYSPIGEHHMILKALASGVTEHRIAESLDVNVQTIRQKRNLLNGICPEAVEILRDKRVNANAFAVLRRMKPLRQIEAAGFMVAANKFTYRFSQALLAGTRTDLLATPARVVKPVKSVDRAQKSLLEQETDALLREFKAVEESYGADVLVLSVCCGYLNRLLNNAHVLRYLTKRYPEILQQLQQLLAETQAEKTRPAKIPAKRATVSMKARAINTVSR
jgi:hypothetical protein